MQTKHNPVVYFEIPVLDIDRAVQFYNRIFGFEFEIENFDDNEMAYFPFEDTMTGITGALVKGEIYKPTKDGVLIYFTTADIEKSLRQAIDLGARLLYPVTEHLDVGFAVAEFQDPEGNRIGLHQKY